MNEHGPTKIDTLTAHLERSCADTLAAVGLYDPNPESGRSGKSVSQTLTLLECEIKMLRMDQRDWRKGVELIGSALGAMHGTDNLSCTRIADVALAMRAVLENVDSLFSLVWCRGITRSTADYETRLLVDKCLDELRKLSNDSP